jgi:hypothetical protein
VLNKRVKIRDRGVDRDVTPEEAIQYSTLQAAFEGNGPARRQVLKWIIKRDAAIAKQEKPKRVEIPRVIVDDPENASEALILLGIATRDPSDRRVQHLRLEPWAVQIALSRRRGGQRLTETEIAELKRYTRNPDSLRWPRGSE